MTTTPIDLVLPIVEGRVVPRDHGHLLYGAIKNAAPQLGELSPGIHPLRGEVLPAGLLYLPPRARLRIRIAADRIAAVLPLAGRELRLGSHLIRLGAPQIEVLEPQAILTSSLVVMAKTVTKAERGEGRGNRFADEAEILTAIKAVIGNASVRSLGRRSLVLHKEPKHIRVPGIGVVIEGLDPDISLRLQAEGLGGRRAFGCGIVVKAGPKPAAETVLAPASSQEVEHA